MLIYAISLLFVISLLSFLFFFFFFFNDTAPTEIYPLPLHDALPISHCWRGGFLFAWSPFGPPSSRSGATAAPSARTHSLRSPTALGTSTARARIPREGRDRKSTRLNSSHSQISYAVFCLKKKKI